MILVRKRFLMYSFIIIVVEVNKVVPNRNRRTQSSEKAEDLVQRVAEVLRRSLGDEIYKDIVPSDEYNDYVNAYDNIELPQLRASPDKRHEIKNEKRARKDGKIEPYRFKEAQIVNLDELAQKVKEKLINDLKLKVGDQREARGNDEVMKEIEPRHTTQYEYENRDQFPTNYGRNPSQSRVRDDSMSRMHILDHTSSSTFQINNEEKRSKRLDDEGDRNKKPNKRQSGNVHKKLLDVAQDKGYNNDDAPTPENQFVYDESTDNYKGRDRPIDFYLNQEVKYGISEGEMLENVDTPKKVRPRYHKEVAIKNPSKNRPFTSKEFYDKSEEYYKGEHIGKHGRESYEDYQMPPKNENIFESVGAVNPNTDSAKTIKLKRKKRLPHREERTPESNDKIIDSADILSHTENLNWNVDKHGNLISKASKGTNFPKRSTYSLATPDYYHKQPNIAEKIDINEPLPNDDREPEKLNKPKIFAGLRGVVNGKKKIPTD